MRLDGYDYRQGRESKHIPWIGLTSVLCLVLALVSCGESHLKIVGSSMEPTLHDGQQVRSVPVASKELKRGDIVLFQFAGDKVYVSRLIGMPGETIEIREGHILINNQVLQESYDASAPDYVFGPVTLAGDELFVLADNRNASSDSHVYGPVKADVVKGKLVP